MPSYGWISDYGDSDKKRRISAILPSIPSNVESEANSFRCHSNIECQEEIDGGVNPRKLDQRFELGSNEAIKSLVIGGLGVGFFSFWDIQPEIAMDSSDRSTFLVFEFSGCFLGPSPAASLEDSLGSSISSPIRSEASYLR
jgi:hypothetical protein